MHNAYRSTALATDQALHGQPDIEITRPTLGRASRVARTDLQARLRHASDR